MNQQKKPGINLLLCVQSLSAVEDQTGMWGIQECKSKHLRRVSARNATNRCLQLTRDFHTCVE